MRDSYATLKGLHRQGAYSGVFPNFSHNVRLMFLGCLYPQRKTCLAKVIESLFFPTTNRSEFQKLIESEKVGILKNWGLRSEMNAPSGGLMEN